MATSVIAEAEDGYRVLSSLAKLDSGILESEVIVADTMDGAPLAREENLYSMSLTLQHRLPRCGSDRVRRQKHSSRYRKPHPTVPVASSYFAS
jgi:hypothetical protein